MATKNGKENIVTRLGMKLGSRSEVELDKLRKENALLKKTMDDLSNRKGKLTDSESTKLLERILSLESLREKNGQQLLAKEQEVASLRQQLAAGSGGLVASLQAQLEQKALEAKKMEKLFQQLSEETENLKNQMVVVSTRCQELEKGNPGSQGTGGDGQVSSCDVATVQEHLRDALAKNQQWLVYDQQRESYVQSVLARMLELEQQLNQGSQALQQQNNGANSEGQKPAEMQVYYDKLLLTAKQDLELQKEQVAVAQGELAEARRRLEEKGREAQEAVRQLEEQRARACRSTEAERHVQKLRAELHDVSGRLEEEKRRSAELMSQVHLLQKSLLNQHEEQKRVAVLEQQVQMSAREFENEKEGRQAQQQQLHKVLRELRKAREQIARLEASQKEACFPEPSTYCRFEKLSLEEPASGHTSPSRIPNLLDESFLECPRCHAQYPTSQHRELLAHLDFCFH